MNYGSRNLRNKKGCLIAGILYNIFFFSNYLAAFNRL